MLPSNLHIIEVHLSFQTLSAQYIGAALQHVGHRKPILLVHFTEATISTFQSSLYILYCFSTADKTPIFFHSHSVSKDGCQSPLSESSSFSNKQTICSYDKPLFNMLANEIRKSLKIDLFGIDLICETDNSTPDTLSKPNRYAIIDLNIFPSQ